MVDSSLSGQVRAVQLPDIETRPGQPSTGPWVKIARNAGEPDGRDVTFDHLAIYLQRSMIQ